MSSRPALLACVVFATSLGTSCASKTSEIETLRLELRAQSMRLDETQAELQALAAKLESFLSAPMQDAAPDPTAGGATSEQDAANKLYDRADYEGAIVAALKVLKDKPDDVRMLCFGSYLQVDPMVDETWEPYSGHGFVTF
jgi:hypothetical protein